MYKVTLSMPIYNVAPYVERALQSALNQTFENIEFLLVDDRGTDNSMEIVRRIIKDHPRGKDIHIIEHPHNIGLGAARNTAIDYAKGDYIFFMDSDDVIPSDCIDLMYNIAIKDNSDIVIGSIKICDIYGVESDKYEYSDMFFKTSYEYMIYRIKYKNYILPCTWNKLYKLNVLRKNGIKCIPYHITEDQIFDCQVSFYCQRNSIISNFTYYYIQRDNSVMDKIRKFEITNKRSREYLDIIKYKFNFYEEYRNTELCDYLLILLVIESICYARILLRSKIKNVNDDLNVICDYKCYNINILNILHCSEYWKHILFYLVPISLRKIILKIYSI